VINSSLLQFRYLLDKVIRYSDQIPLRRAPGAPATFLGGATSRGRIPFGDVQIDENDGYAMTGRPFDNFVFASTMSPARGMGGIVVEDRTTTATGKELQPLCAGTSGANRPCKSRAQPGSAYCWRHSPLDPNSGMVYCKCVAQLFETTVHPEKSDCNFILADTATRRRERTASTLLPRRKRMRIHIAQSTAKWHAAYPWVQVLVHGLVPEPLSMMVVMIMTCK
jgi:hypothetical protein